MAHIGVYKTDVINKSDALVITEHLRIEFPDWDVHFDLDDCDKVLRIESFNGEIDHEFIRFILKNYGHNLEPLPF